MGTHFVKAWGASEEDLRTLATGFGATSVELAAVLPAGSRRREGRDGTVFTTSWPARSVYRVEFPEAGVAGGGRRFERALIKIRASRIQWFSLDRLPAGAMIYPPARRPPAAWVKRQIPKGSDIPWRRKPRVSVVLGVKNQPPELWDVLSQDFGVRLPQEPAVLRWSRWGGSLQPRTSGEGELGGQFAGGAWATTYTRWPSECRVEDRSVVRLWFREADLARKFLERFPRCPGVSSKNV